MPETAVSIGDKYVLKIGSERQQIFLIDCFINEKKTDSLLLC